MFFLRPTRRVPSAEVLFIAHLSNAEAGHAKNPADGTRRVPATISTPKIIPRERAEHQPRGLLKNAGIQRSQDGPILNLDNSPRKVYYRTHAIFSDGSAVSTAATANGPSAGGFGQRT
jgi:hypothetical protein